jgi:predicted deacetylase
MPQATVRSDRALVVSLHDVSPVTWHPCRRILGELKLAGCPRTSLLVIPDHHGRGNFLRQPEFCDWLKDGVSGGNEAVLHGYHHRRPRQVGEGIRERWITGIYTAGEGEFFDLPYEAARSLASRGLGDCGQIGLHPAGFIAPAWLLGREAEHAIRDLDFSYTTRISGVLDLQRQRVYPGQSLCWSVRTGWRRGLSLAWNSWLYRRLAHAPLLRIAIHPVDIVHRRIWEQILRMVTDAARERTPHTYESWLAFQRDLTGKAA